MRVLVIGASGLIGSHLWRIARSAGHDVIGTYCKFPLSELVPCDCSDELQVARLIQSHQPDVIVHTAGLTWVDACEDHPRRAFDQNARQPEHLARLCAARGIHFCYISTSYVFDGRAGPYAEEARPKPINVYGRSKLEGEQRIMEACNGRALIPRVICVYGAEAQKKNFAWQVHAAMQQRGEMWVAADQEGNPTFAGDIARWLLALLERREAGVWHLGGPWPECKRSDWARKLVLAFIRAGVNLHPDFSIRAVPTTELKQRAVRPLKAGLVSTKLAGSEFQPVEFDQSIHQMLRTRF